MLELLAHYVPELGDPGPGFGGQLPVDPHVQGLYRAEEPLVLLPGGDHAHMIQHPLPVGEDEDGPDLCRVRTAEEVDGHELPDPFRFEASQGRTHGFLELFEGHGALQHFDEGHVFCGWWFHDCLLPERAGHKIPPGPSSAMRRLSPVSRATTGYGTPLLPPRSSRPRDSAPRSPGGCRPARSRGPLSC